MTTPVTTSEPEDPALEDLLAQVRSARGLDFTGYKRTSLCRRIQRRVDATAAEGYRGYSRYLDAHPDEYEVLFNTILINVTAFFRDAEAWSALREQVLPRVIEAARGKAQIRVWSAGCASGEEPYSLAMMLAEAMSRDDYNRRVKIYATDWDAEALATARRGRYLPEQLEPVPANLRQRYFSEQHGSHVFDAGLRRSVIFGRHDLTDDPPISRVDLILCRNTLMYFNVDAQARVLARLHFSLVDGGFLFLGRAEMLLSHSRSFMPHDLKHRMFTKVGGPLVLRTAPPPTHREDGVAEPEDRDAMRLRDASLDAAPVAQLVFGPDDRLVLFNRRAGAELNLGPPELGKRLQDLELSYRPADLRSLLDKAREQRSACSIEVSRVLPSGETQFLDVTLAPLYLGGEQSATSVTYEDVTRHHRLQEELQQFTENLETAYEELQSSNEELETTNEELQSSNEELETTNEELQAANEEMETINEELRSTNEELASANEQLRARESELDGANGFLQAILASLGSGVAVVDGELRVQMWSAGAVELWGLRADEVRGAELLALDIGLPVGAIEAPLRDALATGRAAQVAVDAVNRRGRALRCRVAISPLAGTREGAITIVMDPIEAEEPR